MCLFIFIFKYLICIYRPPSERFLFYEPIFPSRSFALQFSPSLYIANQDTKGLGWWLVKIRFENSGVAIDRQFKSEATICFLCYVFIFIHAECRPSGRNVGRFVVLGTHARLAHKRISSFSLHLMHFSRATLEIF